MKIYLAGAECNYDILRNAGAKRILISFFSFYNRQEWDLKKIIGSENIRFFDIFLDSGAYGAWTQNKTIDVYRYIDFIKQNELYLGVYAQLDDKNDNERTKRNLKIMESAGLRPIPVYQRRMNDKDYLDYLCREYDYVAIGGMAGEGLSFKRTLRLLRWVMSIAMKYGTKIHAFGITGINTLKSIPLYSADSTSWLSGSRFGWRYVFQNGSLLSFKKNSGKNIYALQCFKYKNKELDFINAKEFVKFESYITKLWEKRGVVWKE